MERIFEIKKQGIAGTLESSDIQIMIDQNKDKGINVELKSSVENQFGDYIRKFLKDTLIELGIKDVKIQAIDQGALDCTIRARLITALYRSCDEGLKINWKELDK